MSPTPTPSPRPSRPPDPNMVPTQPHSQLLDLLQQAATWVADRPWLAAAVPAGIVAAIVARSAVWGWRHRRLVRITPPPEVDPAGASAWWANLFELLAPSWRRRLVYGVPHVAVEYRWAGRELTIVVWVPGTVAAGPIAAAAQAAWPGAACTIDDATDPTPTTSIAVEG